MDPFWVICQKCYGVGGGTRLLILGFFRGGGYFTLSVLNYMFCVPLDGSGEPLVQQANIKTLFNVKRVDVPSIMYLLIYKNGWKM